MAEQEIKEFTGFCKCCDGEVKVKIEITKALEQYSKAAGICDTCGTYYRAYQVLDEYQVLGTLEHNYLTGNTRRRY